MSDSKSKDDDHRQSVGVWLSRPFVWRIPVYQRHYAWKADDKHRSGPVDMFWETLEEQVRARLKKETPPPHYLGAVLVDDKTKKGSTYGIALFDVVDGQQRLTTIQIALLALIRVAEDYGCKDEMNAELENYIFSERKKNLPRLRPTNFDNAQFQSILFDACGIVTNFGGKKASREDAKKPNIVATSDFLIDKYKLIVENMAEGLRREAIHAIKDALLHDFHFVLISLKESDNAQKVFESLNNYAKPLTTFDLIRNHVFYQAHLAAEKRGTPGLEEDLFYSPEWSQLEKPYWEGKSDNNRAESPQHIQAYVARMLVATLKRKVLFNPKEIFKTYKEFSKEVKSVEEEIQQLVRYVDVYQYLDSVNFQNPTEGLDFGIFRPYTRWSNRDFYPVIFCVVSADVSIEEKQRMLKLLESYVIRRAVCRLSTEHYNQHAAGICRNFGGNRDGNSGDNVTYDNLREFLVTPEAPTTVFPADLMVKQESLQVNFYASSLKHYVFERIEKHLVEDKSERGDLSDKLTIDHILPKAWEKESGWKEELGENADPLAITPYINTIGNLTLMSSERNVKKSNHSWKDVNGLLAQSPMQLNRELAKEGTWNVAKIAERGKSLAKIICEIWPYDIK